MSTTWYALGPLGPRIYPAYLRLPDKPRRVRTALTRHSLHCVQGAPRHTPTAQSRVAPPRSFVHGLFCLVRLVTRCDGIRPPQHVVCYNILRGCHGRAHACG